MSGRGAGCVPGLRSARDPGTAGDCTPADGGPGRGDRLVRPRTSSSGAAPRTRPRSSSAAGDADDPYQPTDEDRAEIRDLLDARAQALEGGDRQAFLATVDPADDDLVDQQTDALREPPEAPGHVGVLRRRRRRGVPDGEGLGGRPAVPSRGARAGPARRRPPPGDQHPREHLRAARRGVAARRRERPWEVPRRPRAAVATVGRDGRDPVARSGPTGGGHRPRRPRPSTVPGRRHRRRHPLRRRSAGHAGVVRRAGRRHHGRRGPRDEQRRRRGGGGRDVRGSPTSPPTAQTGSRACGSRSTRSRPRRSPRTSR